MNIHLRAALERAAEPYQRAGFIIVTQSEDAITLGNRGEKFNYVLFTASLVLFWPFAIYYIISFNNRRHRTVGLRITSQGYVEERGYTLDLIARERRREWWIVLVMLAFFTLLVLTAIAFLMAPKPSIQ